MAKSTVHSAYASLQLKFQDKIREVGQLRAQLDAKREANGELEVQRLRANLEHASEAQLTLSKALKKSEFELEYAKSAYNRLDAHNDTVCAALNEAKASASCWKGFTPIAVVLGFAVGALSTMAYLSQMGM